MVNPLPEPNGWFRCTAGSSTGLDALRRGNCRQHWSGRKRKRQRHGLQIPDPGTPVTGGLAGLLYDTEPAQALALRAQEEPLEHPLTSSTRPDNRPGRVAGLTSPPAFRTHHQGFPCKEVDGMRNNDIISPTKAKLARVEEWQIRTRKALSSVLCRGVSW